MVSLHQKRMLPRNFPKLGSFFINRATKFSRIELEIQVYELCFGFQRNIFAFEYTLVRCFGCIMPFDGLIANAFFCDQFERRLKEVDVEPQIIMNAFEDGKFLLCFPAVIANGMPHNGPVLLLDMGLIVFLIWARTRKCDLLV